MMAQVTQDTTLHTVPLLFPFSRSRKGGWLPALGRTGREETRAGLAANSDQRPRLASSSLGSTQDYPTTKNKAEGI